MSILELRERLIDKILQTENTELLGEVFRLLEIESEDMGTVNLSEQQKQAILKGQQDIMNGNTLTNEQADKEIAEWLNK